MVYREGDRILVKIPVRFRRRNGRQMIFAAGEGADEKSKSDNHALVVALARGWQWQEELESGQYASLEELAQAKGVDRSYAGRLLKLTSLAPEIVEALIAGQERVGASLRQLRRGIPLAWEEQRELWALENPDLKIGVGCLSRLGLLSSRS
jgi:hypothetical protein